MQERLRLEEPVNIGTRFPADRKRTKDLCDAFIINIDSAHSQDGTEKLGVGFIVPFDVGMTGWHIGGFERRISKARCQL